MPYGSGRKKGGEWGMVSEVEGDDRRVLCDYCMESISNKIERIRNHLKKCSAKKELDKHKKCSLGSGFASSSCSSSSSNCSSGSSIKDSTENYAPPTKSQKVMTGYVVSTSQEQRKKLDMQAARFFFSSNIPFCAVENEEFVKFCSMMRPGYIPPNRKKMGGELLDAVHHEVAEEVKSLLAPADNKMPMPVILLQDGWSNVSNDPIIAHTLYDGSHSKPYLLAIEDAGSAKKTADYCFSLIKAQVEFIQHEYDQNVSFCSE